MYENKPKSARDDGMTSQPYPVTPKELVKARCSQGHVILTDTKIIVQLSGFGRIFRQQIMERTAYAGIDVKPIVLGMLNGDQPTTSFIFYGKGGQTIKADLVNGRASRAIISILTGKD